MMNEQSNNDLIGGILFLACFAMLGSFLLTLTRKHYQTRIEQVKLFLCAIGVRFAASIVVYELGLVKVLLDEDSAGWSYGVFLANGWNRRRLGLLSLPEIWAEAYEKHQAGYYYLSGLFCFVTGSSTRLPIAAMNCFFGALTVILIYRTAILLFSRWTAARAGWIACFFPSLIIWSAQTLKEPVVIFLEGLAMYACVNLKLSGFSVKYVLLCATAIVLLPPFRFYAAYLAGAAAVMALVIPRIGSRIGKSKSSLKTPLSALAVLAFVAPLTIYTGLQARNEAALEKFSQLEEIERYKHTIAREGSGVENNYDLNSPTGMAMAIVVGGAHLLLAPFPWQLGRGSSRMLLTTPELLVWWWLVFVGLIPGLRHICKTRLADALPMLFFMLGLGLLYSMMFGNVGLIFRQRAQLLPWLLIIVVVGLEQRAIRRHLKRDARRAEATSLQPKQAKQPERYFAASSVSDMRYSI